MVYSSNIEDHLHHLALVLQVLRQHTLFAKRSKCTFGSPSVDYLGHIISGAGVQANPSKIEAMTKWPVPKCIKELRGFLDLTGYYRRFVKDYGKVAKPLTNLLKKGSFTWSNEADNAFQLLKEKMSQTPILALPDFDKPFVI